MRKLSILFMLFVLALGLIGCQLEDDIKANAGNIEANAETIAELRRTVQDLDAKLSAADASLVESLATQIEAVKAYLDSADAALSREIKNEMNAADEEIIEATSLALSLLQAEFTAADDSMKQALEGQIAALQTALEGELAEAENELEGEIEELAEAEADLEAELAAKVEQLQGEFAAADTQLDEALRAHVADVKALLEAADGELDAELKAHVAEVKGDLEALIANVEAVIGEWSPEDPAREDTVKAAIEALETLTAGFEGTIKEAFDGMKAELDAKDAVLEAKLELGKDANDVEYATVKAYVEAVKAALEGALENAVAEINDQIALLATKAELTAAVEAINETIATLATATDLQATKEDLEAAIATANGKINALEESSATKTQLQEAVAELNNALDTKATIAQLTELSEVVDGALDRIAALEQSSATKEELADLEEELAARLDALETLTAGFTGTIKEAVDKVAADAQTALNNAVALINQQLEDLQARAAALEALTAGFPAEQTIKAYVDAADKAINDLLDWAEREDTVGDAIAEIETIIGDEEVQGSILYRLKYLEENYLLKSTFENYQAQVAEWLGEWAEDRQYTTNIRPAISALEKDLDALEAVIGAWSEGRNESFNVQTVKGAIEAIENLVGSEAQANTILYRIKALEDDLGTWAVSDGRTTVKAAIENIEAVLEAAFAANDEGLNIHFNAVEEANKALKARVTVLEALTAGEWTTYVEKEVAEEEFGEGLYVFDGEEYVEAEEFDSEAKYFEKVVTIQAYVDAADKHLQKQIDNITAILGEWSDERNPEFEVETVKGAIEYIENAIGKDDDAIDATFNDQLTLKAHLNKLEDMWVQFNGEAAVNAKAAATIELTRKYTTYEEQLVTIMQDTLEEYNVSFNMGKVKKHGSVLLPESDYAQLDKLIRRLTDDHFHTMLEYEQEGLARIILAKNEQEANKVRDSYLLKMDLYMFYAKFAVKEVVLEYLLDNVYEYLYDSDVEIIKNNVSDGYATGMAKLEYLQDTVLEILADPTMTDAEKAREAEYYYQTFNDQLLTWNYRARALNEIRKAIIVNTSAIEALTYRNPQDEELNKHLTGDVQKYATVEAYDDDTRTKYVRTGSGTNKDPYLFNEADGWEEGVYYWLGEGTEQQALLKDFPLNELGLLDILSCEVIYTEEEIADAEAFAAAGRLYTKEVYENLDGDDIEVYVFQLTYEEGETYYSSNLDNREDNSTGRMVNRVAQLTNLNASREVAYQAYADVRLENFLGLPEYTETSFVDEAEFVARTEDVYTFDGVKYLLVEMPGVYDSEETYYSKSFATAEHYEPVVFEDAEAFVARINPAYLYNGAEYEMVDAEAEFDAKATYFCLVLTSVNGQYITADLSRYDTDKYAASAQDKVVNKADALVQSGLLFEDVSKLADYINEELEDNGEALLAADMAKVALHMASYKAYLNDLLYAQAAEDAVVALKGAEISKALLDTDVNNTDKNGANDYIDAQVKYSADLFGAYYAEGLAGVDARSEKVQGDIALFLDAAKKLNASRAYAEYTPNKGNQYANDTNLDQLTTVDASQLNYVRTSISAVPSYSSYISVEAHYDETEFADADAFDAREETVYTLVAAVYTAVDAEAEFDEDATYYVLVPERLQTVEEHIVQLNKDKTNVDLWVARAVAYNTLVAKSFDVLTAIDALVLTEDEKHAFQYCYAPLGTRLMNGVTDYVDVEKDGTVWVAFDKKTDGVFDGYFAQYMELASAEAVAARLGKDDGKLFENYIESLTDNNVAWRDDATVNGDLEKLAILLYKAKATERADADVEAAKVNNYAKCLMGEEFPVADAIEFAGAGKLYTLVGGEYVLAEEYQPLTTYYKLVENPKYHAERVLVDGLLDALKAKVCSMFCLLKKDAEAQTTFREEIIKLLVEEIDELIKAYEQRLSSYIALVEYVELRQRNVQAMGHYQEAIFLDAAAFDDYISNGGTLCFFDGSEYVEAAIGSYNADETYYEYLDDEAHNLSVEAVEYYQARLQELIDNFDKIYDGEEVLTGPTETIYIYEEFEVADATAFAAAGKLYKEVSGEYVVAEEFDAEETYYQRSSETKSLHNDPTAKRYQGYMNKSGLQYSGSAKDAADLWYEKANALHELINKVNEADAQIDAFTYVGGSVALANHFKELYASYREFDIVDSELDHKGRTDDLTSAELAEWKSNVTTLIAHARYIAEQENLILTYKVTVETKIADAVTNGELNSIHDGVGFNPQYEHESDYLNSVVELVYEKYTNKDVEVSEKDPWLTAAHDKARENREIAFKYLVNETLDSTYGYSVFRAINIIKDVDNKLYTLNNETIPNYITNKFQAHFYVNRAGVRFGDNITVWNYFLNGTAYPTEAVLYAGYVDSAEAAGTLLPNPEKPSVLINAVAYTAEEYSAKSAQFNYSYTYGYNELEVPSQLVLNDLLAAIDVYVLDDEEYVKLEGAQTYSDSITYYAKVVKAASLAEFTELAAKLQLYSTSIANRVTTILETRCETGSNPLMDELIAAYNALQEVRKPYEISVYAGTEEAEFKDGKLYTVYSLLVSLYPELETSLTNMFNSCITSIRTAETAEYVYSFYVSSVNQLNGLCDPVTEIEDFSNGNDSKVLEANGDLYLATTVESEGGASISIAAAASDVPADEYALNVNNLTLVSDSSTGAAVIDADIEVSSLNDSLTDVVVNMVINIGAGLDLISFKHDGVALTPAATLAEVSEDTFFYDSVSGDLTFKVSSFSPFEIVYHQMIDYFLDGEQFALFDENKPEGVAHQYYLRRDFTEYEDFQILAGKVRYLGYEVLEEGVNPNFFAKSEEGKITVKVAGTYDMYLKKVLDEENNISYVLWMEKLASQNFRVVGLAADDPETLGNEAWWYEFGTELVETAEENLPEGVNRQWTVTLDLKAGDAFKLFNGDSDLLNGAVDTLKIWLGYNDINLNCLTVANYGLYFGTEDNYNNIIVKADGLYDVTLNQYTKDNFNFNYEILVARQPGLDIRLVHSSNNYSYADGVALGQTDAQYLLTGELNRWTGRVELETGDFYFTNGEVGACKIELIPSQFKNSYLDDSITVDQMGTSFTYPLEYGDAFDVRITLKTNEESEDPYYQISMLKRNFYVAKFTSEGQFDELISPAISEVASEYVDHNSYSRQWQVSLTFDAYQLYNLFDGEAFVWTTDKQSVAAAAEYKIVISRDLNGEYTYESTIIPPTVSLKYSSDLLTIDTYYPTSSAFDGVSGSWTFTIENCPAGQQIFYMKMNSYAGQTAQNITYESIQNQETVNNQASFITFTLEKESNVTVMFMYLDSGYYVFVGYQAIK